MSEPNLLRASSAARSAERRGWRLAVRRCTASRPRTAGAWDPGRSKLGGMFELGFETGLSGGETVLYLGAASGTTVSHVADFAGPTYAVEFAPRPARGPR